MIFSFGSSKIKKIINFIETLSLATPATDGYSIRPVKLFKHQLKYITDLNKHTRLIVLKSKQIGETVASLCNIAYTVNHKPKSTVLLVSTNETDLQEKRVKLINIFAASGLPYRYDYENIIDCGNESQIMFLTLDGFFALNNLYNKAQNSENTFIYFLDTDLKMETLSSITSVLNKLDKSTIVITIDNRKSTINPSIYKFINNIANKNKIKMHIMTQYKIVFKKNSKK